jgi:glutamate-1-semialdehyde 2,1-aminomutase
MSRANQLRVLQRTGSNTIASQRYSQSRQLDRQAGALFPGGHHLSGRPLIDAERSPMYFQRGAGSMILDVDGHAYVDFILAYGAILLGYANREVDEAAIDQLRSGSLLSLNHPLHVKFLETVIPRFPGAEMGVFLKTGSEATTAALRIARRATGRRKVIRAGYHGWHDWCLPLEACVPDGLDAQILEFRADTPGSLRALLEAHPGDIAAVIVAPEMVVPFEAAVFHELQALIRAAGAVFVLDEVKTALRTRPGTAQQLLDIRPDLTTVSKALGNGWPVAAVVGTRAVMESAAGLHLSATYHGDTASMAAALATLAIADRDGVADHLWRLGSQLTEGLRAAAARHGVPAEAYGEPTPAMPFLRFTHPDAAANEVIRAAFYTEVLARGILLHPRHMWFICAAHTQAEIERALDACDHAFAEVARVLRETPTEIESEVSRQSAMCHQRAGR